MKTILICLICLFTLNVKAQVAGTYNQIPTTELTEGRVFYITDKNVWVEYRGGAWHSISDGYILQSEVINLQETLNLISGGTNYRTKVEVNADVICTLSPANTLKDTGLQFPMAGGTTYRFYAVIPYTAAAITTGSRWTITAPATTWLSYTSTYTLTATTQTINHLSAINLPSLCNATSNINNLCIIEGVITPTVNGIFKIQFASEILNSAITLKKGATLEHW